MICYINEEFNFKCLLYYSNKKWSQSVIFFENCKDSNNHKGISSSNANEYLMKENFNEDKEKFNKSNIINNMEDYEDYLNKLDYLIYKIKQIMH